MNTINTWLTAALLASTPVFQQRMEYFRHCRALAGNKGLAACMQLANNHPVEGESAGLISAKHCGCS